jgi:hypothetical protein
MASPTTFPNVTAFPGPQDVYIPGYNSGKQQANLIVSYARNPKKFAVAGFTTVTPTQNLSGMWLSLRPEALGRVFQDPNAYIWVDGQPFPTGNYNTQDFRSVPYQCFRRAMPDYLGQQTAEQAVWPIESTKIDALGHIMMTLRATVFYTLMLNPLNYLSTHVATATQWSGLNGMTGGGWQQGTETNPIIARTLRNVANQITQDTLATVNIKNLTCIIDPTAAINAGSSAEVNSALMRSRFALGKLTGRDAESNGQDDWGLPDKMGGMDIQVDPTLQTISPRLQVPGTFSYTLDYNTAIVVAKPGQISEDVGQVNSGFSSVHMFVYRGQEMVVKSKSDDWNQFTKFGIYETYGMSIVAPETCALVTSLFV